MLRKSPHILITTPESLHIMLTSVRGRGMFSGVRAVIVDEIHAIAGTKRGAHLALTLERLERCATHRRSVSGSRPRNGRSTRSRGFSPANASAASVDCGLVKQIELSVESPVEDLGQVGGTIWPALPHSCSTTCARRARRSCS
jgi:ATP-dependent Lhr-like helicase